MPTTMEFLGPVIMSAAAILTVLTVILAPSYVSAKVRRALQPLQQGMLEDTIRLKQERARAAGTIATAQRRGAIPKIVEMADDEEVESDEGGILEGLAQSFGVNLEALKTGDPAEMAKVQQIMGRIQPKVGGSGQLDPRDLL